MTPRLKSPLRLWLFLRQLARSPLAVRPARLGLVELRLLEKKLQPEATINGSHSPI